MLDLPRAAPPEIYANPTEFDPARFLARGKTSAAFGASELFPFGGGTRRCIGMAFALYQMKMVLARLFARTDLEIARRPIKVARQHHDGAEARAQGAALEAGGAARSWAARSVITTTAGRHGAPPRAARRRAGRDPAAGRRARGCTRRPARGARRVPRRVLEVARELAVLRGHLHPRELALELGLHLGHRAEAILRLVQERAIEEVAADDARGSLGVSKF